MLELTARYTVPAALSLLPPQMDTPGARALLLAIGLQESRFAHRRQVGGPARGFWQFELGGVREVLQHPASGGHIRRAAQALGYPGKTDHEFQELLEHNDVLACVFARLLLYTLPGTMPAPTDSPEVGWQQYLSAWRPGKPHRATWNDLYTHAWQLTYEKAIS